MWVCVGVCECMCTCICSGTCVEGICVCTLCFRKLCIVLDGADDNYLPQRMVVQGGEPDNLKILNTIHIDW